jgi:putative transposase
MVRYRRNFLPGGSYFNPVEYKLVSRALDWPYSSLHAYVRRGVLPADWAGDAEEPMMDFGERSG